MNDFKDGNEEYAFGILGPIPISTPDGFTLPDLYKLAGSLWDMGYTSQDAADILMHRFGKTFGKNAAAPAGGEVLFSWEGLI